MGDSVVVPPDVRADVDAHLTIRLTTCILCHHRFGPYREDHKRAATMRELPLTALTAQNHLCLEEMVAREFSCPGCGTAVAIDIQDRSGPILEESMFTGG
jgi:acetone carboxylase gamma subunit